MNAPNNRLMKARRVAGFRSARAAAASLGVNPVTYATHENGSRKFSVVDANRYAEFYEVSPGWILTGEHFEGGVRAKVREEPLSEPAAGKTVPKTRATLDADGNMSDSDILNFGKQTLELLGQFALQKDSDQSELSKSPNNISVGEVIIKPMLYENFDPDKEQWEIVEQWQIPSKYLSEVLNVSPTDLYFLAVIDDNMSPSYEIKDRLIIDFGQTNFSDGGVYIFIDLDEKIHIQRVAKFKSTFKLTNDNPANSVKHPTRTVDMDFIKILGKVYGVFAAR